MKTVKVSVLLAIMFLMAGIASQGGPIGIHFQTNPYGFGPYSVSSFGSAFGAAAADWLEVGPTEDLSPNPPTTTPFSYTTSPFSSPSMNGGSITASLAGDGEWCAFGYCYANQPGGNNPTTGNEAVLCGFIFGSTGSNIVVAVSGLKSFTSGYTATLIASDDNGTGFLPAFVTDGTTSETVNFVNTTQGGDWNGGNTSPQDEENTVNTYSNDTFTVTISGTDTAGGTRNALAGIVFNFTPKSSGGTGTTITIQQSGGNAVLTWAGGGTLQEASVVTGPYTNVTGAVSGYTTPIAGRTAFFRVSQ